MKRIITFFLLLSLVLTLAIPVSASKSDGIAFTSDITWKGTKTLLEIPMTFDAWVCFPKDTSGRGGVILSTYGDNANESISFEIYANGAPRIYWVELDGTKRDWIFENVNVYTGAWEQITIVRNQEGGTMDCYLGGQLAESLPLGQSTGDLPLLAYCLGGDHRKGNDQYCKGRIKNAAIYGQALKPDALSSATPLLQYAPDGTETGIITDLSGNGYDLTASTCWISEKEPVTDYAYSFMVIGDTQKVAINAPNLFPYIYDYVADNVEKKNVKFVMGLGDITDKDTNDEWAVVKQSFAKLQGVVPYSVVRGNHDSIGAFTSTFPASCFEATLGGTYNNSILNAYHTFEVGKVKYLVLCLDYGCSDQVLEWANEVVEANPDRNVIITTHSYLYRNGTTLAGTDLYAPSTHGGFNDGDQMWDKLIKKHENIVLVLSGHDPNSQIVMTQTPGDHGNIVTQMLIDGQTVDLMYDNCGFVTTLYFSEDGRDVSVEHYAVLKSKYYLTENQFTFTLDLIEPAEEEAPAQEPENTDSQEPQSQPNITLYVIVGAGALLVAVAVVTIVLLKKKK